MKQHQLAIFAGLLLLILSILACAVNLPSQDQISNGVSTAQALGDQASELATRTAPTLIAAAEQARDFATQTAPTLQAARTRAVMFATEAAPTVVALRTQASTFATEAAPTLEAGLETLATAAVDTQERAIQARATLNAAGIDGGYLFRKVAALRPNEEGQIIVTFTEAEVNVVLNARLLVMKSEGDVPPVQDINVQFQDGVIVASSMVSTPIEGKVEVQLLPIVNDGRLSFEVLSTNINNNQAPQLVTTQVEGLINSTTSTAVNGFVDSVQLNAVLVENGTLTFIARRAN